MKTRSPVWRRCVCLLAGLLPVFAAVPAVADTLSARTGVELLGESTDTVKTAEGRQQRLVRMVYDLDNGTTSTEIYTMEGERMSRTAMDTLPGPSERDIERALRIVRADTEVGQIMRRQGGLQLEGGFPILQRAGEGPCVRGTRCVQMFLFDGENVVRHMLVDLRSGKVLEPDYIPPRNRGVQR